MGSQEDEPACRYCFEGEEGGELISPCSCSGGQKWVHLACLRRWQRGVLVSQPTHPDFYDDDVRHRVCNVCKGEYTCKPPTRLELMQSFTGEELAALVEDGCIIAASRAFSGDLRRQMEVLPLQLQEEMPDRHWVDGVFLIVQVVEHGGTLMRLEIQDAGDLATFLGQLSEDWCWRRRERNFRLLFEGPLQHLASEPRQARLEALRQLPVPCLLALSADDGPDCGEDGIMAVNLTRPIDITTSAAHVRKRLRFRMARKKVLQPGESLLPAVSHFVGGPCQKDTVQACIVISGPEEYQTYPTLTGALRAAQELLKERAAAAPASAPAAPAAGSSSSSGPPAGRAKRQRVQGQVTTVADRGDEASAARSQLGGGGAPGRGAPAAFEPPPRREAAASDQAEAEPASARPATAVRVHVFWGTAGWSRCQLMGEIASGSWGLCRSTKSDVTSTDPSCVYDAVYPRLVFAPKTEMSDRYNEDGAADEAARRAQLEMLRRRLRRRLREAGRLLEDRQQRLAALEAGGADPQPGPATGAAPPPAGAAAAGRPDAEGSNAGSMSGMESEDLAEDSDEEDEEGEGSEEEEGEEELEAESGEEEGEEEAEAEQGRGNREEVHREETGDRAPQR